MPQKQLRERSTGFGIGADPRGEAFGRAPFPARVLGAMLDVTRDALAREVTSIDKEVSSVVRLGSFDATIVAIE